MKRDEVEKKGTVSTTKTIMDATIITSTTTVAAEKNSYYCDYYYNKQTNGVFCCLRNIWVLYLKRSTSMTKWCC